MSEHYTDEDVEASLAVLREHPIECTGVGEVTCRGCRDARWMTWDSYRSHLAKLLLDAVAPTIAARALRGYAAAIKANPSSAYQTALDVAADIPEWIEIFIEPRADEIEGTP